MHFFNFEKNAENVVNDRHQNTDFYMLAGC